MIIELIGPMLCYTTNSHKLLFRLYNPYNLSDGLKHNFSAAFCSFDTVLYCDEIIWKTMYKIPDNFVVTNAMLKHVPSRFTQRVGHVKILLLGLPCSGKTTLYNLLAGNPEYDSQDSFLFSTTGKYKRISFVPL